MEIERLHKMLTDAGIEHEFVSRGTTYVSDVNWGYQIIVYKKNGKRLVSAIEGYGTYGYGLNGEQGDLIEIMGLLTPEEEKDNSVAGWLTAEDVFERIKRGIAEDV